MRNAKSRINTAYFLLQNKISPLGYGIIEVTKQLKTSPKGDNSMITQKQLTLTKQKTTIIHMFLALFPVMNYVQGNTFVGVFHKYF